MDAKDAAVRRGRKRRSQRSIFQSSVRRYVGVAEGGLLAVAASAVLMYETSWVDALYCASVTLTTVGFGDVCPSSPRARCGAVVAFACFGGFVGGPAASRYRDWLGLGASAAARDLAAALVVGAVVLSRLEGWDLYDALWCCVCVASTVGFGDVAPATAPGRLFCAAYALAVVALAGDVLGDVADNWFFRGRERRYAVLGLAAAAAAFWISGAVDAPADAVHCAVATLSSVGYGDACPPVEPRPAALRCALALLIYGFAGLVQGPLLGGLARWAAGARPAAVAAAVAAAGAALGALEGWPPADGPYFAFVTATTLGYGDHAPLSPRGRVAAAALALGSVGAAPAVVDAAHATLADAARALAGVRDDAPRRPKKRV